MPPFEGSRTRLSGVHGDSNSNVVTIDVGGQLFQTTKQTLSSVGPKSFFSDVVSASHAAVPFIDRDPELFSLFLSLLRTGNLPSKAKSFDMQDLIFESRFYGIEDLLIDSQSNPSQFDAFNLEKSVILPLGGRDPPSAIATTPYGSLHVAHGSKITSFDWSLRRKSTILTQFMAVDSLLALSPSVAAAGATDYSGLQILDLDRGTVERTLNWENVTKSGSTVQAIGASSEHLFTSFESSRRNSNCIMVYDRNDDLRPAATVGHYEIYGADLDSAIPATKLQWIPNHNLLMASGSHSGPSGVSGNIKFYDIRTGNVALELKEKVDCFADVTASDELSSMFKVGVSTGQVFMADLRSIGGENSWFCLGDEGKKAVNGKKEGSGCRVQSHGRQVFCSKGGDLQLWSEVLIDSRRTRDEGFGERVFRKNMIGRAKDMGGSRINEMCFGGNKMFVTRKDQQCVEVWNSVKSF